ncbi:hypothetical protein [Methylocella silvestris]|uniref:Uncharacterized protein n=1 Tax=Methylocella silvestris TaxID=199596 RepID=A0A2J7TC98_METSI|nr:hypothetical protein [Methylocella silvestris]PNG24391.1 hypothetical protein CR492_19080 [Methylocella silvestris]
MKRSLSSLFCALPIVLAAQAALAQAPDPNFVPPPLPVDSNLPVFGAGGGRVLFGVPAEAATLHALYPPLPADAPKPSAEPRNFEGAWGHDQVMIARIEWDMYGADVPFTPAGREIRDRRVKSTYDDKKPYSNASAECKPPGQPWLLGLYYTFHIFQTKDQVLFQFAMDHAVWVIRLNQQHRDPSVREYMGDSIGHWEGDTLVVESTNFKKAFWIDVDGTPASKDAKLVFRIRKIYDGKRMEILTTVDDPKNYTAPWTFVRTIAWRPDKNVLDEYNCELQVSNNVGADVYGLIPDPDEGK